MSFDAPQALAALEHATGTPLDALGTPYADAVRCAANDLAGQPLNPIGRRFALEELLRWTKTRVALAEVVNQPAPAPGPHVVVITGLPRTGSTVLHHLVSQVDGWWAPDLAAGLSPFAARPDATAAAQRRLALLDRIAPGFRSRHPMGPDWPEECITLLGATGHTMLTQLFFDLPAYSALLTEADWTTLYREHFAAVTALAPAGTTTIVLKAPAHLGALPQLLDARPDTTVIRLWRPLDEVLDSWAGLVVAGRSAMGDTDTTAVRDEWDRYWRAAAAAGADRPAAADIDYRDLQQDPARAAATVLDTAGAADAGAPARWRGWLGAHPRDQFGHVPAAGPEPERTN